jgi:hypothetical protein
MLSSNHGIIMKSNYFEMLFKLFAHFPPAKKLINSAKSWKIINFYRSYVVPTADLPILEILSSRKLQKLIILQKVQKYWSI